MLTTQLLTLERREMLNETDEAAQKIKQLTVMAYMQSHAVVKH